jgi:hypothetical protein
METCNGFHQKKVKRVYPLVHFSFPAMLFFECIDITFLRQYVGDYDLIYIEVFNRVSFVLLPSKMDKLLLYFKKLKKKAVLIKENFMNKGKYKMIFILLDVQFNLAQTLLICMLCIDTCSSSKSGVNPQQKILDSGRGSRWHYLFQPRRPINVAELILLTPMPYKFQSPHIFVCFFRACVFFFLLVALTF